MTIMTPHEKLNALRSLEQAHEAISSQPTTTPCGDCRFWAGGSCLKWKEIIPADVIPVGCDEWIFNPLSPPF